MSAGCLVCRFVRVKSKHDTQFLFEVLKMTKSLTRLVVAGVPEHFNLPWHLAIETGAFERVGVEVEFVEHSGGTGAMTRALRGGEADLALLLTEGCVADLLNGNPAKIVKTYVASPLIWGIHVANESEIETIDQIRGKRYAISRMGSGSHLIGIVDAVERGWDADEVELVKVGNLDGAIERLGTDADVFFWEKYTTNPLVMSKVFRRVDVRKTLWPAFVVCARDEAIALKKDAIKNALNVVNQTCAEFMDSDESIDLIAQRYGLKTDMVAEWFGLTRWDVGYEKPLDAMETARKYLERIGIVSQSKIKTNDLWLDLNPNCSN